MVFLLSVSMCISCSHTNSDTSVIDSDSSRVSCTSRIDGDEAYEREQYVVGDIKGHNEKYEIVGNFTGTQIDTLKIVEATREEYEFVGDTISSVTYYVRDKVVSENEYSRYRYTTFDVVSSNPNIPILHVNNNLEPKLNFEGDLDGDGIDEFGIGSRWGTSSCKDYYVYTLVNNRWCYFIEPFGTSLPVRESGLDLVTSIGSRDSVKIVYADLTYGCSAPKRDSIVAVKKSFVNE